MSSIFISLLFLKSLIDEELVNSIIRFTSSNQLKISFIVELTPSFITDCKITFAIAAKSAPNANDLAISIPFFIPLMQLNKIHDLFLIH